MTTVIDTTDADLLVAMADGDRRAFAELYERHSPWLLVRLRRRCADPGMVEEVIQDTFVAVWRKPASYQGTGEVAAWLWGIAVRRLIDHMRKRVATPVADVEVAGLWPSPEEEVLSAVEHGELAGAINRLSPELRGVVQATLVDGLTTREAGRLLGIPAGTVKTRMMRAKPLLREGLREGLLLS